MLLDNTINDLRIFLSVCAKKSHLLFVTLFLKNLSMTASRFDLSR